jgi:hypothetical protein
MQLIRHTQPEIQIAVNSQAKQTSQACSTSIICL